MLHLTSKSEHLCLKTKDAQSTPEYNLHKCTFITSLKQFIRIRAFAICEIKLIAALSVKLQTAACVGLHST